MRFQALSFLMAICPHLSAIEAIGQEEHGPAMEKLIADLGADTLETRLAAEKAVLKHWDKWAEKDIQLLGEAEKNPDSEIASRAKELMKEIRILRAFKVQLLTTIKSDGMVEVGNRSIKQANGKDDPALASAFKEYATPPRDPSGKNVFVSLRLFVVVEASVPAGRLHQVLTTAVNAVPIYEVFVRLDTVAKGEPARILHLAGIRSAVDTNDEVGWKDKFMKEVNYHYQTQQLKNAEIESLQAALKNQESLVKLLEERIKRLEDKGGNK